MSRLVVEFLLAPALADVEAELQGRGPAPRLSWKWPLLKEVELDDSEWTEGATSKASETGPFSERPQSTFMPMSASLRRMALVRRTMVALRPSSLKSGISAASLPMLKDTLAAFGASETKSSLTFFRAWSSINADSNIALCFASFSRATTRGLSCVPSSLPKRWANSAATRWILWSMLTSTTPALASASARRMVISRRSSPRSSAVSSRIREVSSMRSSASISPMSLAKFVEAIAPLLSTPVKLGVLDIMSDGECIAKGVATGLNWGATWPANLLSARSIVAAVAFATSSVMRSRSDNALQRSRLSLSKSLPNLATSSCVRLYADVSAINSSRLAEKLVSSGLSSIAFAFMAARSRFKMSDRAWSPAVAAATADGI
mmetsp:Transcript_87736/g.228902  ORF Transcript_87736/g.228902 Transcript_87736/m.228902 type:complete len:376 (+) Transcript_87736:524-1651(+)